MVKTSLLASIKAFVAAKLVIPPLVKQACGFPVGSKLSFNNKLERFAHRGMIRRNTSNNRSWIHHHVIANVANILRQSGTCPSGSNVGQHAVKNRLIRPRKARANDILGIGCLSFGNTFNDGELKVLSQELSLDAII